VTYILNTVKKSGKTVLQMMKFSGWQYYYDEDTIEGKPISGKVVVNHSYHQTQKTNGKPKPIAKVIPMPIKREFVQTSHSKIMTPKPHFKKSFRIK
jgi:hypothetical protein